MVARLVAESRRQQGLPRHVTDSTVLTQIACYLSGSAGIDDAAKGYTSQTGSMRVWSN